MPTVAFRSPLLGVERVCPYQPDGRLTLLELARRHQLPLHWRCGLGTCGTCVVQVRVLSGPLRPMDSKERNVLAREGWPTELEPALANARLACCYVLSGESLQVEW